MNRALCPVTPPLAALALLVLGAPSCLEAGRGQVGGDTQATDTAPADTAVADTTTDLCAGQTCDDQDPCTDDLCDPQTGACQHYAYPTTGAARPREGCGGDWDCDDGDRCTRDFCTHSADGCGTTWSLCEHAPILGCQDCHLAGCPTAEPCSLGVCQDDGSCAYVASRVGDCAFQCSSLGALSVSEARSQLTPGAVAKVAGRVTIDPLSICADGASCPCTGAPTLTDGASSFLPLDTPDSGLGDDTAWSCLDDACSGVTPVCGAVHYDASYWVWGTARSEDFATPQPAGPEAPPSEDPVPAVPPLPPVDGLRVLDYCLQTNTQGLPGRYVGTFTSPLLSAAVSLDAAITVDSAGKLWLTLSEPPCPQCGASEASHLFPQVTEIEAGDGWIAFDVAAPTQCSAVRPPPRAKLMSQRNTLVGAFEDVVTGAVPRDPNGELYSCASGAITLARLHAAPSVAP